MCRHSSRLDWCVGLDWMVHVQFPAILCLVKGIWKNFSKSGKKSVTRKNIQVPQTTCAYFCLTKMWLRKLWLFPVIEKVRMWMVRLTKYVSYNLCTIAIFIIALHQMTGRENIVTMWKGSFVVMNLQRIISWICSFPRLIVSFSSLFICLTTICCFGSVSLL